MIFTIGEEFLGFEKFHGSEYNLPQPEYRSESWKIREKTTVSGKGEC